MKEKTEARAFPQGISKTQSILKGICANPLIGGPASPTPPDRVCSDDMFAGVLVADPRQWPESLPGAMGRKRSPRGGLHLHRGAAAQPGLSPAR